MTNLRYYIKNYVTVMVFFFVFNTIAHAECSYNDAPPIVLGTFQGKAMVAYEHK